MADSKFSQLEVNTIALIEFYGKKIREKRYWERGNKQSGGINIYIPPGGNHPKPKPRENFKGSWQPDSPEYLIIKEFLDNHQEYNTKNARLVRGWYGIL